MEDKTRREKDTIILGVIGSDCHSVGNKILELFFTAEGFKVVNLGVMVSQQEFVNAAIESNAKAILISSLYGHGEIDCQGFRDLCLEKGLDPIILYAGGNLVVGKTPFAVVETKFKKMGFDRVFPPDVDLKKVAEILRQDIKEKFGLDSQKTKPDKYIQTKENL
ncbi:MAG: methylaspartate mutase subunit S [Candidatus Saccharicenans sp.]|nr:MAG: methylaspartate mutase subunit S [Candidatus Aminicenantes bacterium]HEK85150.1 methylaspartate mutase subunit S [Candidatus Aminicenantes bacterium]